MPLLPLSKNSAFWMKKRPVRGGVYFIGSNLARPASKKRKVSMLQSWLTKLFNWTSKNVPRHASTLLNLNKATKKDEYKNSRSKNQTILDFLAVQNTSKAQLKKSITQSNSKTLTNNRDSVATLSKYDINSDEENEEEIGVKRKNLSCFFLFPLFYYL